MELSRILLVDSDSRSARRPESSLSGAGHVVTMAWSGEEALEQLARETPDLVLSETKLAGMDGYELAREFRKQGSGVPFAFLTRSRAVEDRLRALELGVEDYLTKPIFVRDLVSRVNLLLSRKAPDSMPAPEGNAGARTRMSGSTSEVSLIDVLQTCEVSRKSAVVRVQSGGESGAIYVRDGVVVDAEVGEGRRRGEQAVYRILLWHDATFVVDFETIPADRETTVSTLAQEALLIEAMNRADAWTRLGEKMPPLSTPLRIDNGRWLELLRSLSEDASTMLRLFDGKRSVARAIDEGPYDDVSALAVVSQLYDQGVLVAVAPDSVPPEDASAAARPVPRSVPPLAYTLSATELLKRFSMHLRGPT
jgi:DNA-binding response OmpR family regulator